MDNGAGDLFRVIGDDLKPDGTAAVLGQLIRDSAGHKSVENTQNYRFKLIVIDKEGYAGNHHVHQENQPEDTFLRMKFVDDGRYKVRAAAVGTGPDQQGVTAAVDDTGNQRTQDLAGAVFRGIGQSRNIHIVQQHRGYGKGDHIDHAANRQGFAHLKIYP